MWNEYIAKCSSTKYHNVLYYSLTEEDYNDFNNMIYDLMEQKNDDEPSDETNQSNEFVETDIIARWIEEHKQTVDKYEYILMSDINNNKQMKQDIVNWLVNHNYKYSTTLFNKLRRSGYKKNSS